MLPGINGNDKKYKTYWPIILTPPGMAQKGQKGPKNVVFQQKKRPKVDDLGWKRAKSIFTMSMAILGIFPELILHYHPLMDPWTFISGQKMAKKVDFW